MASRAEYDRLIAEWLKNGKPTSEATLTRNALKVLKRLYGHTWARDFGPKALKVVRQAYIDARLSRVEVNRRAGLVVRFFNWAVGAELVPPSVHHGLRAVAGLGWAGLRPRDEARPGGP